MSKSLACPNCNSANIEAIPEFIEETVEQIEYDEEEATMTKRRKVYECQCNNCKHEYVVDYGEERHIVFSKPVEVTCIGDVKLLALSQNEDGSDYKIVSIGYSGFDKNITNSELSYLMFIEGEEFPVLLSKQTIDEMLKFPDKAQNVVKTIRLARYR